MNDMFGIRDYALSGLENSWLFCGTGTGLHPVLIVYAPLGLLGSPESEEYDNDGYSPSQESFISPERVESINDGCRPSHEKHQTIISPERAK